MFLYKILFFLLSRTKRLFYKIFYAQKLTLGKNVDIDYKSRIVIKGNAKIVIKESVHLRSKTYGYHSGMPFPSNLFADGDGAFISIGKNSRLNGSYIHSKKQVYIGDNCTIASGVNILDANGHKTISKDRTKERDIPVDIRIENNVWIGLNAIILKGTIIGKNSVVGANSVVKGEFPSNSIIMGNPAVLVKRLVI